MGGVGGVWRIYSFGIHSILQRLVEDYRVGTALSVVCTTTRYITVFQMLLHPICCGHHVRSRSDFDQLAT